MSEQATNPPKKYKRSPALNASIILVFLSIVLLITLAMFVSFDEVTNRFEAGKVDIVLEEPHWDPKDGDETVPNTFIDKDPTITNKEDTVNTYVFLEVIVPYEDNVGAIIEKAYQDDSTDAGKIDHMIAKGEKVPYYKFVPTGNKIDDDLNNVTALLGYNNTELYNETQKINDTSWKLLDGYPIDNAESSPGNKTWTYVYAYVQENNHNKLEQLLPNTTVKTPLFNKIYLLNFRERAKVENETHEITVTPFPDPTKDYSIKINAYGIQANFLKPNNLTTDIPEEVWAMLDSDYTYTQPTEP